MVKLKDLRIHFDAGDLTKATVVPAVMASPGEWQVQFKTRKGADVVMSKDKVRNGVAEVRIFKSADAALSACKEVGFRKVDFNF